MVIDKKGISINICFSSDNNYAQHLGVTIISILKNAKKEDNYNFYIMDGGIDKKNKNRLDKLKKIKNFNITYINIDNQDFSNCPMTNYVNYITLPTYYRFKIPTFFPDIDKILYMDCDMIVRSDIAPLFETNIDNYYLAAVPEVFNHNHKDRLEFKFDEYYFNAGLLLINNKKWKEDNIEKRLFKYALNPTHEIVYQDQDILNEVLKGRVKYLPLKWNLQHDTIFYDESYLFHKDERIDALEEPFIIHFTHKLKPWLIECTNPYKYEYKKYLRISPWKSYIYKMRYDRYKKNLLTTIKKLPKLIFSVRNQNIHKVITFLGIQIKLKNKTLFFKQQINEIKEYQYWKMDKLEGLLQHICAQNEKISNNEHRLCEHINLIDSEIISINKKMNEISEELLSDNQINKLILNQDELLNRVEDLKNIFQGTKHDYLKNEQLINMQSSLILEDLLKNNDVEQNILNLLKINGKIACSVWSNKVQDMLSNMEYLFENNTHIEFIDKGDYSADLYILWGTQPYTAQINTLKNAIYRNKPFIILEDGFLKSIETSACKNNYNKYHKGVSFVAETKNMYYDARQSSTLEQMLNDKNLIITEEQKKRARTCIDKIVETYLTKYNHQPIYKPNIGRNGVKKVLVVDQSYGDMSIAKGLASDDTFRQMLEDAITENPNADIIVKTHPDTIAGAGGYYKGLKAHDNIYTMTEAINPISLIKYCDEVYVCTTQLGFEALMCDKTVHVYGMPFYAGWGLTDDKQICERRTNKRSLEEVFYIAYIMYTYYVNPDKKCRCEIEDAIEYLLNLRKEYFDFINKDFSLNSGERQTATKVSDIRADHVNRYNLAIEIINKVFDKSVVLNGMDVFCGNGYGSFLISNNTNSILTSIDGSKDAIECAEKYYRNNNITFKNDFFPFDIKENCYDFIVSLESVEHIKNDKLFLKNLHTALNDNGILIISTPNKEIQDLDINPNPFHYRHYYNNEFIELTQKIGFKCVEYYGQDVYIIDENKKVCGTLNPNEMNIKKDYNGQFTIFILKKTNLNK